MLLHVTVLMFLLHLAGCAPAVAPVALDTMASALSSLGATAISFKGNESTVALNSANKELVETQAAMTRTQILSAAENRERLMRERAVTAKLLREMSGAYGDWVFRILAEWVDAGGDPDFAFKYALTRIDQNGSAATKVIPQQSPSNEGQKEVQQSGPSQASAVTDSQIAPPLAPKKAHIAEMQDSTAQ
jgi:hypothetical protein